MTKRNESKSESKATDPGTEQEPATAGASQASGETAGEHAGEEALRRAKEEFDKARQWYEKLRHDASERVRQARESGAGEVVRGTLELVRKHPGPSVVVAMLVGFFLGRLFRR